MRAKVRLADEKDVQQFLEFMKNTPNNLFDPAIANYPNLRTVAVDIEDKSSLYAPFHPVILIESLARRPDTTRRENAYAINEANRAIEGFARQYGMAELYWQCADQSLIQAAMHHGYTLVQTAVLKKKVLSE